MFNFVFIFYQIFSQSTAICFSALYVAPAGSSSLGPVSPNLMNIITNRLRTTVPIRTPDKYEKNGALFDDSKKILECVLPSGL